MEFLTLVNNVMMEILLLEMVVTFFVKKKLDMNVIWPVLQFVFIKLPVEMEYLKVMRNVMTEITFQGMVVIIFAL